LIAFDEKQTIFFFFVNGCNCGQPTWALDLINGYNHCQVHEGFFLKKRLRSSCKCHANDAIQEYEHNDEEVFIILDFIPIYKMLKKNDKHNQLLANSF
jgi:hypothetical protein